jgi:hypothetical protein
MKDSRDKAARKRMEHIHRKFFSVVPFVGLKRRKKAKSQVTDLGAARCNQPVL